MASINTPSDFYERETTPERNSRGKKLAQCSQLETVLANRKFCEHEKYLAFQHNLSRTKDASNSIGQTKLV